MKLLRKLLFPFSILYGIITWLRNFFYDIGWLKSTEFDIPVVCVGNLSTGGTGKSPMIEYLIELLQQEYRVKVLSRGYKRKTTGFLEVEVTHTASEVGDEPLQFKKKFPNIIVAVCADRRTGISKLKENADVILLDDAFQHRKVKPSTNILLTPFNDLYIHDYMLPTGNLREPRSGAKRADFIIVTKCPEGVSYAKLQEVELALKKKENQKVYFSKIGYDAMLYGVSEILPIAYLANKSFTLVTGIANPAPLVEFLKRQNFSFDHEKFPDHHHFTTSEIARLKQKDIILTTEKDYVRLQPSLQKFALYYLPIKTLILREQSEFLNRYVKQHIDVKRLS
ncbi:tetraacyldisaccharide 4'-kinase [Cochleicola gelatinilyticus]|uniref:Tetraacyldisaccharide 4'-kinase n=1 Tax=Cochleicola gelatinilyticus TaxID=1763537 RepID=A0A167F493_9FLAO|nr:tetraacyldisaccharide 4'-kinase [Cochleicola gelatinilyticus]OAB76176.1 tetraacyldisaccharide 4'-kinase [Cochleicola gelatinilyticus]